jgi:hypothetical protein
LYSIFDVVIPGPKQYNTLLSGILEKDFEEGLNWFDDNRSRRLTNAQSESIVVNACIKHGRTDEIKKLGLAQKVGVQN